MCFIVYSIYISELTLALKYCNKSFKRPQDLKKHEKTHLEEQQQLQGTTTRATQHPLTPPTTDESKGHHSRQSSAQLLQQNYPAAGIFPMSPAPTMMNSPPHSTISDGK